MAMFGARIIFCRSLRASIDSSLRTRPAWSYPVGANVSKIAFHCIPMASGVTSHKHEELDIPLSHLCEMKDRMSPLSALVDISHHKTTSYRTYAVRPSVSSQLRRNILHPGMSSFPLYISMKHDCRAYSSDIRNNRDDLHDALRTTASSEASTSNTTDSMGNEWVDILNSARKSVVDAAASAGKKAKEVSDEVVPHLQQFYDSHPYLEKVIVPVGWTLSATILAWFVLPRFLRKLHKYAMQSPFTLLSRTSAQENVLYEKSLWSALEDPARYLLTFMAFSQLGVMIAPSTSQYLYQGWRGATVLSFVWFLNRWKTNVFISMMANQATVGIDRDKLMTLEKMSSVGLLVLGSMALAEACGVPVQSILTIGGIGGVATAFASRDILGNLFSGLSLQFSKPFSIGDNIKAGSVEGQVVEMGLTTTSLLNLEKFPVTVPNSLFASQVIVNKSRAQWRASTTKIPVRIDCLEKIPVVSKEIKSMLRSNSKVFLEKDAPYCYLSRIESSFAELTLGYNLVNMKKDEFLATEQEILLQAARIIKQHGAELGNYPSEPSTSH